VHYEYGSPILWLRNYLRALFLADPGYYRVIVFVATDVAFVHAEKGPSEDETQMWLRSGLNSLPTDVGARPYTSHFVCTALIYEFRAARYNEWARLVLPSHLDAYTHLVKSGIWGTLAKVKDSE
jgi:hypothetical protein